MTARLRPIVRTRCATVGCDRYAVVELVDHRGDVLGRYCTGCGEMAERRALLRMPPSASDLDGTATARAR